MANLVVAAAVLGVLITGVTVLANSWLEPVSAAVDSYQSSMHREGDLQRTRLVRAPQCDSPLGRTLQFAVLNDGQAAVRNFRDWDLIAYHRSDGDQVATRLAYTEDSDPTAGEWTVTRILGPDGAAELVEPGIVNGRETANITAAFSSAVWASRANRLQLVTESGSAVELGLTGVSTCSFYLHNVPSPPSGDTTVQAVLLLDRDHPGQPTLSNYDTDRDSTAGLLIKKGGSGPGEADPTLHQVWRTAALDAGLALAGTISVDLYAATAGFSATSTGQIAVFLREFGGSSHTEVASSTVTVSPWDPGATGSFVKKTVDVTGVNYTVAAGSRLEIELVVPPGSDRDMMLAYDTTAYPSAIRLPERVRLLLHSEQKTVAGSGYHTASGTTHEGGYYLHDNPSPPTAATSSQADLPASRVYPAAATLYNYDVDRDAAAGRLIARVGSGAGESDLSKYQNWLTTPLEADLALKGSVQVELWTAMEGFDTGAAGEVTVYLRDYGASMSTAVLIGSATLTQDPWDSAATGGWVKKRIEVSGIDRTFARGRRLEVKVVVGSGADSSMLFAYDTTSYPSVARLPGQDETRPDGRPTTLTADGGSATGRFRPSSNEGRFVFPLDGYTKVSDSTWTVTYRVRAADVDDADVRAEVDVLVRDAGGTVRATLATGVATTTNITATEWTTKTATFTPAEYTVADPTDYLEIDLFANVTRNDGSVAMVEFRVDDNGLAPVDQTSVSNVGLLRD